MAGPELGSFFDGMYAQAVSTMASKAGIFVTDGQDLAATLMLITISWVVVVWMLSSDGATAIGDAIGIVTRYSIVAIMLTGWVGTVGGFFQGNANDLAQRLTGTSSVSETVNLILAGVGRLIVSERSAEEECKPADMSNAPLDAQVQGLGGMTCLNKAGTGATSASWWTILVNLPMVMMTWLLRLFAMLMMGLFLAAFLTVIFMAEILFGIGLTLGPILAPWLIWQRMEFLFDGWLRFMIAAMLTKIVAAYMVMATTGLVMGLKTYAELVPVTTGLELLAVDETTAFLLCVICAIGAFLMWQVPGIAQGLMSGSLGARLQGFGKGFLGQGTAGLGGKNSPLSRAREDRIKSEKESEKESAKEAAAEAKKASGGGR